MCILKYNMYSANNFNFAVKNSLCFLTLTILITYNYVFIIMQQRESEPIGRLYKHRRNWGVCIFVSSQFARVIWAYICVDSVIRICFICFSSVTILRYCGVQSVQGPLRENQRQQLWDQHVAAINKPGCCNDTLYQLWPRKCNAHSLGEFATTATYVSNTNTKFTFSPIPTTATESDVWNPTP